VRITAKVDYAVRAGAELQRVWIATRVAELPDGWVRR